ncbi:MAG: hypothetical protein COU32_01600 [Candidatus Magasanikbacteria bacterium CG10_big_fil_rev_8_21_14_0_10_42_10]|uniref:Glycosyltransferase 2-like domain-containing protein n=2 Tax=Candidatus Magasanikiibacteriota TaxID=1752731 RepID=A0A2H0TWJ4_9BACT|nr:MAG: hypothetical protein COU32_01600 [Candidatus Magasanikbacteria bacterium CG10_big_fil_rev_8_21_14_0_10_42_10]PIZ94541.1 MAG: hypothetical protein COX82_00460 [Candidatus Magasanikbacteria bacterium CG_4_10_14_0_2_um_filter_41_10]
MNFSYTPPIDVSIIIPARNEENFLPACLTAISAMHTKKRVEVIVVDNGSTDRTKSIAESYGVNVLAEMTPGVGRARARGTAVAQGTYVLHIDADTQLPPEYIDEALHRFEADTTLVCLGGRVRWYDAGKVYNGVCTATHILFVPLVRVISRGALGPIGNNMMFTRDAYERTTGFDPDLFFGEDADIARKLHRFGTIRLDLSLLCATSSRRFRSFKNSITHIVNTTFLCLGFQAPYNHLSKHTWRRKKSLLPIDK